MRRRTFLKLPLFLALSAPSPSRLVAFGDSITSGLGAAQPYAPTLAGWLARALDNQAVAGSHIAEQRQVIEGTALGADDWVVWLCGYNNMRAGTALAAFRADLDAALASLCGRSAWVWVGNCLRMTAEGYQEAHGPYGSDARVAAVNAEIAGACLAAGARYVDASAAYDPRNVQADLVHPDDAGHREIAGAFARAMRVRQWVSVIQGG